MHNFLQVINLISKQEAPSKLLGAKIDSTGGQFVKLPKQPSDKKKKKSKKARVEIEYEMESDQPIREKSRV